MSGARKPARILVGTLTFAYFILAIGYAADHEARAHLVRTPDKTALSLLENREASQEENLAHARYVCRRGANQHKRWACQARGWIARELAETRRALNPPTDWAAIQMRYGNMLARASSGDPWPSCPDPHDGSGASWYDTVRCENNGSWLDSPGYYRCGLQFDPMWERFYGRRFCP
jgi:hypothetical protein